MDTLETILASAKERGASDIFFISGRPISFKINGEFYDYSDQSLVPSDTEEIVRAMYSHSGGLSTIDKVLSKGDDDISFAIPSIARYRACLYKQRGSLAAVIRVISFVLPNPDEIHIPQGVMRFADFTKGLVLVTGPAGSGKSMTLSCLIDKINSTRANHIITLEDPIEFLHKHKKSIVSQREISLDTLDYLAALKAALRQAPDVILLGELRDPESISIAMTAAETGHLVLSTLHTLGASNTIDRIVDSFPAEKQPQIRLQLSMVLQGVISQQLIRVNDGTRYPAFEIMHANPAVKTMIRDAKTHQIESAMQTYAEEGMLTMESSLLTMFRDGMIDDTIALAHCFDAETMKRKLKVK